MTYPSTPIHNQRSYTAEELEQETGFDRRTIAYYVQEDLLSRVGRRGRRTRYPALVRDRLLFIQQVREAEELGEIEPLTLQDLRGLFEKLPQRIVNRVASRVLPARLAVEALDKKTEAPARSLTAAARRAAREHAWRAMESAAEQEATMEAPVERMAEPSDFDDDLKFAPERYLNDDDEETLKMTMVAGAPRRISPEDYALELIELLKRLDGRIPRNQARPVETWSRVRITPDIELAVRGLNEDEKSRLELVAESLRRLLRHR